MGLSATGLVERIRNALRLFQAPSAPMEGCMNTVMNITVVVASNIHDVAIDTTLLEGESLSGLKVSLRVSAQDGGRDVFSQYAMQSYRQTAQRVMHVLDHGSKTPEQEIKAHACGVSILDKYS